MDDSQMLEAVRHAAGLPDAHPDYTDARIRQEINDCLQTVFARSVVHSGGGYWLQQQITDCVADQSYYAIPGRALVGGLKAIEYRPSATDNFTPLVEAPPEEIAHRDTTSGRPSRYYMLGDQVRLMPTPSTGNGDIRFWYYLRPPRLVQEQITGTVYDGTTTTAPADGWVNMAITPLDRDTGSAITTSTLVDVIAPTGGHEVRAVGLTVSSIVTDTSLRFDPSQDLSRIRSGDIVRAADQTDWPTLPREYHRTLADATAAVILAGGIGALQKAGGLSGKVANDLERFEDLIQPRVKDAVRRLRPRHGALRHGRAGYRRHWPVAPSS